MERYRRYQGNATVNAGMASPSCQKNMHENGNRKNFFFQSANRWSGDSLISNVMHILFAPLSPCACSIYGRHFWSKET